jgi:AmpD protein
MKINEAGWLEEARRIPSENCDDRPEDSEVSLLVIHNISLPPGEYGGDGIIELFTNRLDPGGHPYYGGIASMRVSAHFLIRRDGEIIQFVPCTRRAWHAGASEWCGQARCNDFSVGIELEGSDLEVFTDAQYVSLAALAKALMQAYPIRDVVGHSDISPGRKTDPGPYFDWGRFKVAIL